MATRRKNTQKGNPRRGKSYTVSTRADGRRVHTYADGRKVVLPKQAKKKQAAKAPALPKEAKDQPWYSKQNQDYLMAQLGQMASNPLKAPTGDQAVLFAQNMARLGLAPSMLEYDRQEGQLDVARQVGDTASQRLMTDATGQLQQQRDAADQAAAAQATALGQMHSGSVGEAQARQQAALAAADRENEVSGGYGTLQRRAADEAAARQQADLDRINQSAQARISGDRAASQQLFAQMLAAQPLAHNQRVAQAAAQRSQQLRDINEGRAKSALSSSELFAKTFNELMGRSTETELAKGSLLSKERLAEMENALGLERVRSQSATQKANRKSREKTSAADRRSREKVAAENRKAANQRHRETLAERRASRKAQEKKSRQATQAKERGETKRFVAQVNTAVNSARIRREVLTAENRKNPARMERMLKNRGVTDELMRQIIIDRHTTGGPSQRTAENFREYFKQYPPAAWTTRKVPRK